MRGRCSRISVPRAEVGEQVERGDGQEDWYADSEEDENHLASGRATGGHERVRCGLGALDQEELEPPR